MDTHSGRDGPVLALLMDGVWNKKHQFWQSELTSIAETFSIPLVHYQLTAHAESLRKTGLTSFMQKPTHSS